MPIIKANVAKETAIITDEGGHYSKLGDHFASHESVSHKADEYVRGSVHTNTVENFYSIFKRGMKGVYQHCSETPFTPLSERSSISDIPIASGWA